MYSAAVVEQALHGVHRGDFGLDEGVGDVLRFLQLGEFLFAEAGLAHEFLQRDRLAARRRHGQAARHEVPVDALVVHGPRREPMLK